MSPVTNLEDIYCLAELSNLENEGIATRCKRVRPASISRETIRRSDSESSPASKFPCEGSAGPGRKDFKFESSLNADVEAGGHGESYEKRSRTKKLSDWAGLDRHHRNLQNSLSEYDTCDQGALPGASERRKMVVPGGPKPINRLKNKKEPSSLISYGNRSSGRKGPFTLEGEGFYSPSDPPPLKRPRLDPENQVQQQIPLDIIEDDYDGAAFTETINSHSTPGAGIRKSVRSTGYPQYSMPLSGGVDEFQRVENIVGFDKSPKFTGHKTRKQSSLTQNGLVQNSNMGSLTERRISGTGPKPNHVILDDDDSIEEVSPGPMRRYRGTTTRALAKQKPSISGSESKDGLEQIAIPGERSRYFPGSLRSGPADRVGPAQSISKATRGDVLGSLRSPARISTNGTKRMSCAIEHAQNLDDEDCLDTLNLDHTFLGNTGDTETRALSVRNAVPSRLSTTKSISISKQGDILPSNIAVLQSNQSRRKDIHNISSVATFDITYIRDGLKVLSSESRLLQLQSNPSTKDFDIMSEGNSVSDSFPTLVVKPRKIFKVTFNKESAKVIFHRSKEQDIGSTQQLLVQMKETADVQKFRLILGQLNKDVRSDEVECDRLDHIFEKQNRETEKVPYGPTEAAHDLEFLSAKKTKVPRLMAQSTNDGSGTAVLEDTKKSPSAGYRHNGFMEDDMSTSQIPKRPLTGITTGPSQIESSRGSSRFSSQSHDEAETSIALQKKNKTTFPNNNRPGTRSSDRLLSFELGFDQHILNTSFQLGWTTQNPGWQEERGWTSPLVYPAEGPKKATVDPVDIDRLDEGGYLNDNLIEFYLLYLEHNLEKNRPEIAKRIYFQNTFFYKTLTKGKTRNSNINYDAVKRWTAKVDIFSFDYIIVPVCEKAHWYVAIICNAPRLLQKNADEIAGSEIEEVVDEIDPTSPLEAREDILDPSIPFVTEIGSPESELVNRAKSRSRSPSVTAKVENLSLEEGVDNNEWTELDGRLENLSAAAPQARDMGATINSDELPSESPISQMRQTPPPSGMANSSKGKRGKRKSMPPSRTYDPSQPRIITLDSLGGSHSPTCSNLQKYLVCEAMAKRQVDISVERLGMTAKGLPQQDNYCDCGIFILGYIEEFLKDPDSFVHDILLGEMTTTNGWAKMNASEMRASIRELLFKLRDEQSRREKELRATKSKTKRPPRTEKIGNLCQPTDNQKCVAEPDAEAEVERDRDDTGQKKTRSSKRISDIPPSIVVEISPVDNRQPLEQIKAKRPRSDTEELKSPQDPAEDRLTGTKKTSIESGHTKISNIPSPRETSPLIPSLGLQNSSPRLETPFKPSKTCPEVPRSSTPEYSTPNPFKRYAKRRSPSADRKFVRIPRQTSTLQEGHSEIEISLDGASDPKLRAVHLLDSLEEIPNSSKIPSKKIRTEGSFKDTKVGPISPTLANSASRSMLYSSPKTPTRTSPRLAKASPRTFPTRKLVEDLAGQYLSLQERQALGTWTPKRRAPGYGSPEC